MTTVMTTSHVIKSPKLKLSLPLLINKIIVTTMTIRPSATGPLVNTAKPIRIPAYRVELLTKWRRASNDLQETLGRTPTPEEIAVVLEIPKKKLAIVKKAINVYNLVPQTDQGENGWTLGEMLMDERTKAPDEEMIEADNLRIVMNRLGEMDKREATVLRMRFGLNDDPPKTLKEIGESLGLEWAGRWISFTERAHLQYTGGLKLADFQKGKTL
jgi:DNA-directed RNA polymerase sigma subunit (sigma70/sigma32)